MRPAHNVIIAHFYCIALEKNNQAKMIITSKNMKKAASAIAVEGVHIS